MEKPAAPTGRQEDVALDAFVQEEEEVNWQEH
jgi:hypothetical protein